MKQEFNGVYFNGNLTITPQSLGVPAPVLGTFLQSPCATPGFTTNAAGQIFNATGRKACVFIQSVFSIDKQGGGVDDYKAIIFKNGAPEVQTTSISQQQSNELGFMVCAGFIPMNNGDNLQLYIQNITGNDDVLITDINTTVVEIDLQATNVTFGTTAPGPTDGQENDVFIKTDTNEFYRKTAGVWSIDYTINLPTPPAFLFGAGAPAPGLGNDGDIYGDNETGDIYQKTAGAWSIVLPSCCSKNDPITPGHVCPPKLAYFCDYTTQEITVAGPPTAINGIIINGMNNPLNGPYLIGSVTIGANEYNRFGQDLAALGYDTTGSYKTGVGQLVVRFLIKINGTNDIIQTLVFTAQSNEAFTQENCKLL